MPKILAGIAFFAFGNIFGPADANYISAFISAFGTEVYYIIGDFYHIKVMLYHEHTIPTVAEPVDYLNKLLYISYVQSCCRLVEHIECAPRIAPRQLGCKLYSLSFSTGKRR